MSEQKTYRVWLAGEAEWVPGPTFPHLALAIDRARRLAVTKWVAIELPGQQWHVFDESMNTKLGPPQFARGSNLNLDDKAAEASDEPRAREFPGASTGNNAYRVSGVRLNRPSSKPRVPFNDEGTRAGLGPEDIQRRPATRTSAAQPVQRPPRPTGSQPVQAAKSERPARRTTGQRRVVRESTARNVNERRGNERYAAEDVLGEPACYVEGQKADVVDVSESGLQLQIPPRQRVYTGSRVVLSFSDRHGRFDLIVKVMWARAGHVGVQIEDGGANLVGKMFLRKLIGQLIARRERAAERARRLKDKK